MFCSKDLQVKASAYKKLKINGTYLISPGIKPCVEIKTI